MQTCIFYSPLQEGKENDAQIRIAKVALTAVCLWLVAWSPYATVVMLAQFGPPGLVTPLGAQFPSLLAKMGSCVNPIIYAISHPK